MPLNPRIITTKEIIQQGGLTIQGSYPFLYFEGKETAGATLRLVELAGALWVTANAIFSESVWRKDESTFSSTAIFLSNSTFTIKTADAGPAVSWVDRFTVTSSSSSFTVPLQAPSGIFGTDPGGTEVLRAQNFRAGAATFTGTISAPTGPVVVGTDPGGTEVLRTQNLRAGSTSFTGPVTLPGDPTSNLHAATKQYVDNLQRYHTVQSNGTSQTQRYTLNFTTGLSASDDPANSRTNVAVVNDTTVQKVEVAKAGTLTGTRKRLNFIEGTNVTITVADDSANNKVDVTIASSGGGGGYNTVQDDGTSLPQRSILNFTTGIGASDDATNSRTNVFVQDDTTTQRVEVAKAGALTGTRKRINFVEGSNVTITVSDDATNNKVDVTIASSGGGATSKPFIVATSANIPATGGATLVRVDATNETWYELEYPDGSTTVADFEIPAVAFTQIRFVWRTPGTSGACRWSFEVREKGGGDSLGGGTVVASGAVNDTAPATANQLKEATISVNYTPGANKRCAMLRAARIGGDAGDTLANVARLLWVELL